MTRTLNITAVLERLVADAVVQVEEFHHIRPEQLLVCLSSTRSGGIHGTYAKIHPLRFPGGSTSMESRRGRRRYLCTMPAITHNSRDILYLIYFLVPRFLNLSEREKLTTVFHELYHISPAFDGDIRRFPGRNYAHGSSRVRYNETIAGMVEKYLALPGSSELIAPLSGSLMELKARHRAVVGRKHPAPRIKLTPLN